jgi:hypothetical protein
MSKLQPQPILEESARESQPGQQLLDKFFNDLTQLNSIDIEVAKRIQALYASKQLSRDAILRVMSEMRRDQNGQG